MQAHNDNQGDIIVALQDILADREDIAKTILDHLDSATDPWGIRLAF